MKKSIQGRVWLFGDNIDTDQMAPGSSMSLDWDERRHKIFPKHRDFVEQVQPGDIIVAGRNFGCGSSREQAVENVLKLGISCVVAESIARIFMRNAVASALPVLTCPGISESCQAGDEIRFDWDSFSVSHLGSGATFDANKYTQEMIDIVQQGGMLNILKQRFASAS